MTTPLLDELMAAPTHCTHCHAPAGVEVIRPLPALWCWVLPTSKLIPVFRRAGWKLATGTTALTARGACQACAAELIEEQARLAEAQALAAAQVAAERDAAQKAEEARRHHQERVEARRRQRVAQEAEQRKRRAQEPITGGLFGGAP